MIVRSDHEYREAAYARRLFLACQWESADAALVPLCNRTDPIGAEALFLRGRIALRRERLEPAVGFAQRLLSFPEVLAKGFGLIVLAGWQLRRGAVAEAQETIATGRVGASLRVRGHLACEEALAHLIDAKPRPYTLPAESFAEFPNIAARLSILQSWLEQQRGRWREQLRLLDQALITLYRAKEPDLYLSARALHAKTSIARERPTYLSLANLTYDIETFPWTPDLVREQFFCLRNAGWLGLLGGDAMIAYRLIRKAQRLAALAPQWLAIALADSAQIANVVNDRTSAHADRAEAFDIMTDVSDASLSDESSNALVYLAEGFAPSNPDIALQLLNRFAALAPNRAKMHVPTDGDPLVSGMIAHARGLMAGKGNTREAVRYLETAYRLFEGADYIWRAAIVARALAQQSNGARWKTQYERLSAQYPRSWFAYSPRDEIALSVAQREVLKLLIMGNQIGDIARERGTSVNTVRNQLAQIRRRYGV